MSVWSRYSQEERQEYIRFLQVYGALSNLFRQKHGDPIPYLDSKYQETIFAKVFRCENVDIGNTPHDVLSDFGGERIGIGIKTWMGTGPSFQKVMQLKRYQDDLRIAEKQGVEALAYKISSIKNERMERDYKRLGLLSDKNIYHYVTRDKGKFVINECTYPLIDVNNLTDIQTTKSALTWSDGIKHYKFTFGDSQIWQKFNSNQKDHTILHEFDIDILDNPFDFLLDAYFRFINDEPTHTDDTVVEAYLPLYSYRTKEVEQKSGLNAWNAAPKNKNSNTPRPLNEIYIPIPIEFHRKNPDFFTPNILKFIGLSSDDMPAEKSDERVAFRMKLPNGKTIPCKVTQSNMKGLQSGSLTEKDEFGKRIGQSALGQWLLVDVLGLDKRELVTRDWLLRRGTDSVKIWRKKDDYSLFNIDFAPIGAFEAFMNDEPIPDGDEFLEEQKNI